MWLSERAAMPRETENAALDEVTLAGESVGVYDYGERRGVKLCAPGGYVWRPRAGGRLLVVKCGDGSEAAAGETVADTGAVAAGEVLIRSDAASIWLKNDGSIVLRGNVSIEGSLTVNGTAVG